MYAFRPVADIGQECDDCRMRSQPIVLLSAVAMVASWSTDLRAAEQSAQQPTSDNVVISRVSDDPFAVSGVIAFAVRITGIVAGEERSYFIPFMEIGQAKPRVGETCVVTWYWWSSNEWQWVLGDGESLSSGRLVTRFRCGEEEPPTH